MEKSSSWEWFCTPVQGVLQAFSNNVEGARVCVLMLSRNLDPMSKDDVLECIQAKQQYEARGWHVAAVYLSAKHDEDLLREGSNCYLPCQKRLLLANRILRTAENTSWLHLDPWESLYNAGPVGEVVTEKRLRAYVKRVCKATVPVFVVPQEALKNKALPVSPPGISNRSGRVLNRLILRVDKEPKLEFFLPLFQERFDHVQVNHVSDQRLVYEELLRTTDYPLVSLDTVFPGDYQLGVSRLYDLGGFKKIGLVSRPGCSDVSSQLHVLNEALANAGRGKQVVLFDDDICSGGTVAFAKMQLR